MNPAEVTALIEVVNKDPTLIDHLTPRELYVFEEYYVKGGKTCKKLAEEVSNLYGFTVSAARVWQIKAKALRKIKENTNA
jgi:DNA-directed RNA polymerase sigma subunit (sigma70/sigma32)